MQAYRAPTKGKVESGGKYGSQLHHGRVFPIGDFNEQLPRGSEDCRPPRAWHHLATDKRFTREGTRHAG